MYRDTLPNIVLVSLHTYVSEQMTKHHTSMCTPIIICHNLVKHNFSSHISVSMFSNRPHENLHIFLGTYLFASQTIFPIYCLHKTTLWNVAFQEQVSHPFQHLAGAAPIWWANLGRPQMQPGKSDCLWLSLALAEWTKHFNWSSWK